MKTEKNQRGYFRIDDEVFLQVKKICHSDTEDTTGYFNQFRQSTIIAARFQHQRATMTLVLKEINTRDTAVASYLTMLSDQLDLLANKLLTASMFTEEDPLQSVNISAEGLRFQSSTEYKIGDQLEIVFALLPSYDYVPVIGDVVRSGWNNDTEEFVTSVNFVNIDEDDRELLIHHILYLQRQQLRHKRMVAR